MLKSLKYLILLIFISCNSVASESAPTESEAFPFTTINERILFIGNSFTFYWNLPSQSGSAEPIHLLLIVSRAIA